MASPTTFPTELPAANDTSGIGGVRLSGITYRVFPEPKEQVVSLEHKQVAVDLLRAYGRTVDAADLASWRGNSFTSMSDGLMEHLGAPLPELDFVLLSYETPDLHVADVAGCYLAGRCPGEPVSFSISEQGAGGPFTAMRVADSMYRFGDLDTGALFVYDQAAQAWESELRAETDSAVLLQLGTAGEVCLESVTESVAPDPHLGLAAAMARHPGVRTVIGATLAKLLGPSVPVGPGVVVAPRGHACTSVWVTVAQLWPVPEPLLLVDYHPRTRRLYTCTLAPVS